MLQFKWYEIRLLPDSQRSQLTKYKLSHVRDDFIPFIDEHYETMRIISTNIKLFWWSMNIKNCGNTYRILSLKLASLQIYFFFKYSGGTLFLDKIITFSNSDLWQIFISEKQKMCKYHSSYCCRVSVQVTGCHCYCRSYPISKLYNFFFVQCYM